LNRILIILVLAIGALVQNPVKAQTTFTSTNSGDWDDGATYGNASPGVQGTDWPAVTDNLVVANGHTVTLTSAETINDLTVNSGGVLDDDNKGDITVNGNLTINGTVTGSRNIQFTGGGGEIIDGAGVHNSTKHIVANGTASIASTANLTIISNFEISGSTTVTNNGTVIINTDLKGASATWVNAANSTLKVGMNLLNGGGTLTASASGNTVVYNRNAAQNLKAPSASTYYHLTIEGTGTKTIPSNLTISGSLTITSSTLDTDAANDFDLNIGGDFTNSGTFNENLATVTFDGTGSQTITNSSGETFYDFTINKASGTLTLANDVVVSNTLTMTAGITDAGSNMLTLGTGTGNEGTYSYTTGQIIGQFERWIANTTTGTDIDFPVGTTGNSRIATINFVGITTGGTVLFQFVESDPGNSGLSLVDGGTTIYNTFIDGYWDMETANSFDLGANTFDLDLAGTGFTAFTIDAATRLLTRLTAGSDWIAEGTHVSAVDPTAMRTGLSTMPAQYAFGDDTNCTGPTTSSITGSTEVCTDDMGEAYSVTDNSNTYTWTITGGTQASGGTTASITVDWGSTGQVGNVKVVETNGCTSGAAVNLSVNVNSIAPSSITGKTNVAESTQDEPYSVTDLGYTYTWTITGGTLDTGQGTSSITVDWGTAGVGNVSVVAQKAGCAAAMAVDTDVIKYLVINSAQTGNWATASTWVTSSIPLTTESARILNTHTVTITANETINNFIIDAGGTLSSSNKTLTVEGDITVNGSYSGGSKQLILDGSNASIDGTGTISLNSGVDVDISAGNKTITSTAVLSITQGDLDIAAGITVTNNGSISITEDVIGTATSVWTNAFNSTLKVGSALLSSGTLNASASGNTVEYNASGAQNIKTPSSSNYHHLILSNSGAKQLQNDVQLNGDLTVSGTATLDAATNTAIITLGGTMQQTITGTFSFYTLAINNTLGTAPQIINNNDITVTNTLTLTDGVVQSAGTIIIPSAGTSTGTSAASYIDGVVRKSGNTDFIFPVGDGSIWARAEATSISNADAILEVQYFDAAYTDVTTIDPASSPALNNVSKLEYWEITENSGSNRTAILRLYWEDDGRSDITDVTDLSIAKFDVSLAPDAWTNVGTGYTGTDNGDGTGNVVSTGSVSFASPITFGSILGNNALPVELVSFQGLLQQNGIKLSWKTASEINNDFFEVHTSLDAETFLTLGRIPGHGTTSIFADYEYLHRNPATGINYYRLRQVDYDGTESFSKIVSVNNNLPERLSISVYPNPAHDKLTLLINTMSDGGPVELNIYSTQGIKIKSARVEETLVNSELDVSTLPKGLYIIRIRQGMYLAQVSFIIYR